MLDFALTEEDLRVALEECEDLLNGARNDLKFAEAELDVLKDRAFEDERFMETADEELRTALAVLRDLDLDLLTDGPALTYGSEMHERVRGAAKCVAWTLDRPKVVK